MTPLATTSARGNSSGLHALRFGLTAQLSNQGQSVLLSYANTNTDYTDSGITDLAGNDLASFAFQLDNLSSQDFTRTPDGWSDDNGSSSVINSSESISIKTMITTQGRIRPLADGSNFDWNSRHQRRHHSINGRWSQSQFLADLRLGEKDGDLALRINLENEKSRIYQGQTVTISYDESLIQEDDRVIDFSGNFVGIGTELVTNNSSYINPNPTYEELQSQLDAAQQEVTEKTNNLNNLQSQYDTLQTDYNAALADAAVTEAERNQLQNDLQQTQSDLDQANNDLQFAQTELTNLQGQLDAIPAQVTNGWSESSGQSITIEFDQSISSNNGDDLFSLINNNSLSVYIDGEQLTSTDISNIYFGNPSYDASGGMTDASITTHRWVPTDPNYVP